jgi:hypothetical protein
VSFCHWLPRTLIVGAEPAEDWRRAGRGELLLEDRLLHR